MSKKTVSKEISVLSGQHPTETQQMLFPIAEREVNGIEMGVLEDGTPYLTLRGLSRICGVDAAAISRLISNWPAEQEKPRGTKINELLEAQQYFHHRLHFNVKANGKDAFAIPDAVCMAFLEYYAFESSQGDRKQALENYRYLARVSFREYIYNTCGYDPQQQIPESWKNYHERVLLNDQMPIGFFSVFREIAEIVIHMIKNDCDIDSETVPDISVGSTWANHWRSAKLEQTYGERQRYPHYYPDSFPQASANPVAVWVYPIDALGAFRTWVYTTYLPEKFPNYVKGKVRQNKISVTSAQILLEAVQKEQPKIRNPK